MRITVKISDVEVTIDRANFHEARLPSQESLTMNDVIIPTLQEAIKQVKELYNLKQL